MDTTVLNDELGVEHRNDPVVYFNGPVPVFTHRSDDLASFRCFTTWFIVNGTAAQGQVAKVFAVLLSMVKRGCRLYRERQDSAFFGSSGEFVPGIAACGALTRRRRRSVPDPTL